ncbi:recombinase family protein [Chloroflexota bacterium]
MRAALYARVSTEEQLEGYSIDAQKRNYHLLVQGRGWESVAEYIEEGRSARNENISKRPKFKEAMEDGLKGKYDVLVVDKLDRFARRLIVTLEYFSKLSTAGRSFLSIREQIDFSTPFGKVALAVLAALAEWYSDNLSEETRKGLQERKNQGLYNGALPFGAMKGDDGVPVLDTRDISIHGEDGREQVIRNCDGLAFLFERAATGYSDREIAIMLNDQGYRTTGNHGHNLFTKDTVKGIRKNRFYLGELPDGKGDWFKGRHDRFIAPDVFHAAQRNKVATIRADYQPCSLSGVARCASCGGAMRTFRSRHGKIRLQCANRVDKGTCSQPSAYLDVYEHELVTYLRAFHIPEDFQERILEAHLKLRSAYNGVEREKSKLKGQLERIKDLYQLGHKPRQEYLADYAAITRKLESLPDAIVEEEELEKLAAFLEDIALVWEEAAEEQRNRLASQLFDVVWIENKQLVAVTPKPEFKPFFDLGYQGMPESVVHIGCRRGAKPLLKAPSRREGDKGDGRITGNRFI